jgi:hypothetical protein
LNGCKSKQIWKVIGPNVCWLNSTLGQVGRWQILTKNWQNMVNGKVTICTHEHYEKCIKVLSFSAHWNGVKSCRILRFVAAKYPSNIHISDGSRRSRCPDFFCWSRKKKWPLSQDLRQSSPALPSHPGRAVGPRRRPRASASGGVKIGSSHWDWMRLVKSKCLQWIYLQGIVGSP